MQPTISVIILTFNEEKHIQRCIESVNTIADEIFVVDSFSTDKTLEICNRYEKVVVMQNPFVNQAVQFNWSLQNCPVNSEWIWKIDADEYLARTTFNIKEAISNLPNDIHGIFIKRPIIFQGKKLRHGGMHPVWYLKLIRNGKGYCENKWMDEHLRLYEGGTVKFDLEQIDHNLNDLSWWTEKHNKYSSREVVETLNQKFNFLPMEYEQVQGKFLGNPTERKRWFKTQYWNIPLFVRPFIFFLYRYLFKLGFLDGMQGFIWHILQGFWYRFLVDAKIFELKVQFKNNHEAMIRHIKKQYNITD